MRSMTKLGSLALVTSIAWLAACGGKVFIDLPGAGGNGGSGSAQGGAGAGAAPSVGGGPSCVGPTDPANLKFCGGSVAASGGMEPQCANDFCDPNGNTWEALCGPSSCSCRLNSVEICTCTLTGAGNFCEGTPTCCPLPTI